MVANTLDCPPVLAHYFRFVATTVGRDKLLRTAQYFSQFYIWHLYRRNYRQSVIDPYSAVRKQLGTTRKILRLGNFLGNLQTLTRVMSKTNSSEPVLKYLAIGGQLGFGGYLFFDNITAIKAIGIHKLPSAERLDVLADQFWAAGLICSIMTCLYTLLHSQRGKRTKREDGERDWDDKTRAKKRSAAWIQLISDLCDLTVPGKTLGCPALDDGVVGMAGTMSSLIGVWSQWKETA
ncbi:peroxisomal biogenesis factor 11 [Aspergillus pseudotamarii]|uniref:Peroxisomal biogenesis factor 11 n=1 Tax=Aspergillus pseudotamarii TaxID=132259 RepID=A0A5N6T0K6_ASPPS|nr:peroxisomal biogenesis factor 11 [Aspergillus pseudotamarii]KAE8139720.1 peroxisomal biogenesis factor 11 [Aspergillus pseudotamarii]